MVGRVRELLLVGLGEARTEDGAETHHLGIQASNRRRCTKGPCVRAWQLGETLLHEISYNYFDPVSLGDEIPHWRMQIGMGCISQLRRLVGWLTPAQRPRHMADG